MGRKLQLFVGFVARQRQSGIFKEAEFEFIGFCGKSSVWGTEPHQGGSLAEVDPSQQ